MEKISIYPFKVLRKRIFALIIPFIPILFLLTSSLWVSGDFGYTNLLNKTDYFFGGIVYLSTTDLTQYDQLGADGLIPIMRLGGITKGVETHHFWEGIQLLGDQGFTPKISTGLIIFFTLFLGYMSYAVISRMMYSLKKGRESWGLRGINLSTIGLALLASFIVLFISSFSLYGFQLVLLLNFAVFFALSIPHAAAGEPMGESMYKAFDFIRFNLSGVVSIYLLSMGVAIAAPIGLLLIFMFPLSALDTSVVLGIKLVLSLFGITFALFYQAVVCSRESLDFSRKPETRLPALKTQMAKKVR